MRGVPITGEMRDEIVAMSKVGGFSIADIAEETGASVSTVTRVLGGLEVALGDDMHDDGHATLDAALFVKVAREYQNGDPVNVICDSNSISIQQMYSMLREAGIATRAQQQAEARVRRIDDAIRMYEAGSPLWEIQTATDISSYTLNRELHRRGVPLRRPRKLVS